MLTLILQTLKFKNSSTEITWKYRWNRYQHRHKNNGNSNLYIRVKKCNQRHNCIARVERQNDTSQQENLEIANSQQQRGSYFSSRHSIEKVASMDTAHAHFHFHMHVAMIVDFQLPQAVSRANQAANKEVATSAAGIQLKR